MKIKQLINEGYNFHETNYVHSGTFINTSGGIIGIGVMMYVYATTPELTPIKRSMLFALSFLVLFLTLCLNIVLRLKVPKGITGHHLD